MDWDDLCWNPHESSLQQGIEEGHEAGRLAGYRDGQALGRTKGVEFGIELGFIRGFLTELERSITTLEKTDRIKNSMELLNRALKDESLNPVHIFHHQQQQSLLQDPNNNNNDQEDIHDDSEIRPSKLDVMAKMQRVRARFKVLTVQLGLAHVQLKDIMDQAAAANSNGTNFSPSSSLEVSRVDNEW